METKTIMGILSIILGLIIIACPLAGFVAIAWIVAISLILLGVYSIINGATGNTNWATIILGILFIILGLICFSPFIMRLLSAFIVYLVGIVLIIFAIVNLFTIENYSKYMSIVAIIFGIICLILGYLFASSPAGALYIAIIVGVWFLVSGIMEIVAPGAE